ncbi:MAG: serine/threonine-protein kinase [Gemmataceae bacterium]|nr:serine/threonine-protein kinase [Gemmataceae bacterium]
MTSCPDDEQLREFLANTLGGSALSAVSAHLESCALCQARLDGMTSVPSLVLKADETGAYSAAAPLPPQERAGTILGGRYKLLEPIGEGGMGSVWSAQQSEPVRRKVAIKLIKRGMESEQVLARFETERQALAVMDHPNIAKVFDGGIHNGRPYFVMELVKGVPITDFCDTHRLTPRQRLELFVPVCQAIQHAHQKGIIHRDIKPSNVLIALYDDRPVPKVIDFGVAKATTGTLTEATLETGFGAIVGTPQYMSPEQATFNNLDIDTRTDVYSLGVLLYELLSGSPPFSRAELEKKGLMEILRVVREVDPPRPSTKLSTADALPSLSASRGTEPRKLTGILRNELDWIVMKALEKDRGRRYDSANGFAADIARYLGGEPVLAHPPSTAYRIAKTVRRHKGKVVAASLILLSLIAGIIGTSWQAYRANRATVAERAARAQTEKRLTQIEKGVELFAALLKGINPRTEEKGGPTLYVQLRQRAEKAADSLDSEAVGDPLAVARLQAILGDLLRELGNSTKSIDVLEKARASYESIEGPDHPHTLTCMNYLAGSLQDFGQLDKAQALFEDTLRRRKAVLGDDHPDTLESMNNVALAYRVAGAIDKAVPMYEDAARRMRATLGEDRLETLTCLGNLALAYQNAGQAAKAAPLFEETIRKLKTHFGADHVMTLANQNNLAGLYRDAGQFDRSIPLYKETLEIARKKLGTDHPTCLTIMNNLAEDYRHTGQLDKAMPMYEQSLPLTRAKHGANHPATLAAMNNLALGYHRLGEMGRAQPLYEESLRLSNAIYGPTHATTLLIRNNLAESYRSTGRVDQALAMHEETFKTTKANLGAGHPTTLLCMNNLAQVYMTAGQRDKALAMQEESLRLRRTTFGENHPSTIVGISALAGAYQTVGQPEKALPLLEEAARKVEAINFRHLNANTIIPGTAACCEQMKEFEKAEAWRRKWLAQLREKPGPKTQAYASELASLGLNLLLQKKIAEAEVTLRECLEVRLSVQPNEWSTFNTKSQLGGALLGQQKYAEAEPLLLDGYRGMKDREKSIPKVGGGDRRIPEALERLVKLNEALNKPDEAARWRKELEATGPAAKP